MRAHPLARANLLGELAHQFAKTGNIARNLRVGDRIRNELQPRFPGEPAFLAETQQSVLDRKSVV